MTPHDAILPSACADDATLEALVAGALHPDRQRLLEAHLGSCAACRERLDARAATAEAWTAVREQLSGGDDDVGLDADTAPPIPALAALIKKILAPSDDDHALGRLGPYEIAGIVGSGGMGIVLKGRDPSLDRFVAIKILLPHLAASAAARQRFLREAKAAAAVVHDNVIAIHGVDEFAGLPYLVMPYCRGTTLEKRLRDQGPMGLREILRIGLQTARGLAAAHAQGLVHRDVKPANILLEDGVERVRITDFGLARAADDASLTVTGLLAGTPHYMSPEQALGKPLDARSDLFALGAVLFTMATGQPPFRAESSHAVLRQVTDVEPADVRLANPDLPAWCAGIIRRLLAKDPAARYRSAAEVGDTLEACLAHVNAPLATPLPAAIAAAASPIERLPVAPRSLPRALLDTLRRCMNDQRLLSIAALVIFLMAILLPWPIVALGRGQPNVEPAIAYAVIAAITSLLFAWLGRRDSLGRLVLKFAGGLAAVALPLIALAWLSFERSVAVNRERVWAQEAQAEALQAQLVHVTRPDGGSTVVALAASLERIERWLAEHPQEAVADVTVRHAGNQVSERMTISPGRRIPSDHTLNWDQKEFTTSFVGRSLAEVIRAGGRPAPPTHVATEIGVQTRLEDGDGFQQEIYISGDPNSGAVTTRELRARSTLDGAFRTLVRTRADDFVEVAPGIPLPHRIDIDTFDIEPNQPENVIPRKANSLTIVVEQWRPQGGAAPAGEEDGGEVGSSAEAVPESGTESTASTP
ncbi:MAG: protein kinase domain-containing protein [Planctomycetaceae bacterium]